MVDNLRNKILKAIQRGLYESLNTNLTVLDDDDTVLVKSDKTSMEKRIDQYKLETINQVAQSKAGKKALFDIIDSQYGLSSILLKKYTLITSSEAYPFFIREDVKQKYTNTLTWELYKSFDIFKWTDVDVFNEITYLFKNDINAYIKYYLDDKNTKPEDAIKQIKDKIVNRYNLTYEDIAKYISIACDLIKIANVMPDNQVNFKYANSLYISNDKKVIYINIDVEVPNELLKTRTFALIWFEDFNWNNILSADNNKLKNDNKLFKNFKNFIINPDENLFGIQKLPVFMNNTMFINGHAAFYLKYQDQYELLYVCNKQEEQYATTNSLDFLKNGKKLYYDYIKKWIWASYLMDKPKVYFIANDIDVNNILKINDDTDLITYRATIDGKIIIASYRNYKTKENYFILIDNRDFTLFSREFIDRYRNKYIVH